MTLSATPSRSTVLGDVVSYGQSPRAAGPQGGEPSPVHGLAMARTSDVRRRIEALSRNVLATRLSWRRVAPAVVLGSVLLLVIGGFGFTRIRSSSARRPSDRRIDVARRRSGQTCGSNITQKTDDPHRGG